MIRSTEQIYFERRQRESLARAESANDPAVGKIHREFAAHYAAKLDGMAPRGSRV